MARPRGPHAALTLVGALFALVWAGALASWHLAGRASILDRIEAPLLDLRFQLSGTRPAPSEVVIVAIDDETVEAVGRYPLPRPAITRLVGEIARHGPRALGIDMLFVDDAGEETDRALAEALRSANAVVAAAARFGPDEAPAPESRGLASIPTATAMVWPVEALRRAVGIGVVNVATDHAGTPRHVPLAVRIGGGALLAGFPLRVASLAAGADPELGADAVRVGGRAVPIDLGFHLPLRFYGRRGSITTVSGREVLLGTVDGGRLRDKIVIVGVTAVGTGDTFATPFDPVLPGVEVLATAVGHLVAGDGLMRTTAVRRADATAAVALPLLAVGLMALQRSALALALIPGMALIWIGAASLAFDRGIWLSIAVPLAALIPPALFTVGGRLWLDRWTERRLVASEATFRRFHPPTIADQLADRPDFLAEPVQQRAAVLFIDLSGFTGLSERLGPERTRDLLKGFHSLVEEEVTRFEGVVVSFMGDGAMAVFGLAGARDDDAARALSAALGLAGKARDWARDIPENAEGSVGVRVGAQFGSVVISRLGAETHQHITATGDTVNVASRLLEIAAQHRALVAAGADLIVAAKDIDASDFSAPQRIDVRGRAQPLSVRFWWGATRAA